MIWFVLLSNQRRKCKNASTDNDRQTRLLILDIKPMHTEGATHPVCIERYISTGSKPERCVSWTLRRVACSVHATIE